MGINRVLETGIKSVLETGIKKVLETGIQGVSETGKILVENVENIRHFGYTFYPHLWAPERGKILVKKGWKFWHKFGDKMCMDMPQAAGPCSNDCESDAIFRETTKNIS